MYYKKIVKYVPVKRKGRRGGFRRKSRSVRAYRKKKYYGKRWH